MAILIGTAGWTIPRDVSDAFPSEGSSLERYARIFPVAEINSSFHRPHRPDTWARWRDSVPAHFRFSVKLPKAITHLAKLVDCGDELDRFVEQVSILGEKLAVILVQLPPKLSFDETIAGGFFATLRARSEAAVACEPRHVDWFSQTANQCLAAWGVSRVAADPAICPPAAHPGGSNEFGYWRLHGSPVMYRSSYGDRIDFYAEEIRKATEDGREIWCIFDNTASSAAAADALKLQRLLGSSR